MPERDVPRTLEEIVERANAYAPSLRASARVFRAAGVLALLDEAHALRRSRDEARADADRLAEALRAVLRIQRRVHPGRACVEYSWQDEERHRGFVDALARHDALVARREEAVDDAR